MATSACLPIAADRAGPCLRTIRIVGMDLTDILQRIEIRLQPDNPVLLFALGMAVNAASEGIFLGDVETDANGLKTSVVHIRIAKATMQDATKVPYTGEIGDASTLAYGWVATIDGDDRQLAYGPFVAVPTVPGASLAPFNRPPSFGLAYLPGASLWSAAQLTFSDDDVTMLIDGAALLAPSVRDAAASRDQAAASSTAAALAAATALGASRYFPSKAAGEVGSVTDQLFSTDDGAGNLIYYRRTADGSIEIGRAVTPSALASTAGADLVGYGGRPVSHKLAEQPSSIDKGAQGDGVTDDAPALAAVTIPILFPRQDHYIGQDLTVDVSVEMLPGSRIILPPNVTFTPRSGFRGDPGSQIFVPTNAGRGLVNLREAKLISAHPEWWGQDTSGWASAIEAAGSAHSRVQLQLGDYLLNRTLFPAARSRLSGMGCFYDDDGSGINKLATRLVATFNNDVVVQAGPAAIPPGDQVNDAPRGIEIEDLWIGRTVLPSENDNCKGLALGFAEDCYARRIVSDLSRYSFFMGNSIHSFLEDCHAKCSSYGTATIWVGFFSNGSVTPINANASLYLRQCASSYDAGAAPPNGAIHLRLQGLGTDFFCTGKFETVGGTVGIEYDPSGNVEGSSNDMIFDDICIDQVSDAALRITNLQNFGRFTVKNLYVGEQLGSGAGRAIDATGGSGSLVIKNAELYMAASTAEAACLFTNLVGCELSIYVKDAKRGVALVNVSESRFYVTAFAQDRAMLAAIQSVSGCTDNFYSVQCAAGSAGQLQIAHQSLDASNDHNTFDLSGGGRRFGTRKTDFETGAEAHSAMIGSA